MSFKSNRLREAEIARLLKRNPEEAARRRREDLRERIINAAVWTLGAALAAAVIWWVSICNDIARMEREAEADHAIAAHISGGRI